MYLITSTVIKNWRFFRRLPLRCWFFLPRQGTHFSQPPHYLNYLNDTAWYLELSSYRHDSCFASAPAHIIGKTVSNECCTKCFRTLFVMSTNFLWLLLIFWNVFLDSYRPLYFARPNGKRDLKICKSCKNTKKSYSLMLKEKVENEWKWDMYTRKFLKVGSIYVLSYILIIAHTKV